MLPDGTLRGLPFLGRNLNGITDREVGVLRVDDAENGRPMAVLLSYACHPVVLGPNLEISADYVGYAVNFIEHSMGAGTVALFANGAQGDMNSIVHPFPHSDLVPGPADEHYFYLLPRLIGSAAAMAVLRQRPARVGAASGNSHININRREMLPDGTLSGLPFLGRNPNGITDREVGVLRVDDAVSGKPIAVLLSYACHPVVLGPNLEISADYVGYAVNFIEQTLGAGAIALFANSAQGDMNSIVHPGTFADAERLGVMLGSEVVKVALGTETHGNVQIKTATNRTELPLNTASNPERQRDYIRFLEQEYRRFTAEENTMHAWDIEMRLAVAGYRLYNREQLTYPYMPAEVTAFGLIGDGVSVGLVSEPAELFCEYGMRARQESPFTTTLVLGLANGFIGYVPTPNVYTEGGYECEATNVAPGAGDQLCQTMIDTLNAVA
jgi:neutral ceramidase